MQTHPLSDLSLEKLIVLTLTIVWNVAVQHPSFGLAQTVLFNQFLKNFEENNLIQLFGAEMVGQSSPEHLEHHVESQHSNRKEDHDCQDGEEHEKKLFGLAVMIPHENIFDLFADSH